MRENSLTRFWQHCSALLSKPFFCDRRTLLGVWTLVALLGMLKLHRSDNNFLIFRGVFWHTWNQTSLYAAYPSEYFDVNHYGPLFSVIIAPFAVLPVWAGLLLWLLFLVGWLYVAIFRSGLTLRQQLFTYWFSAVSLLTAVFMQQFNIAIAAMLVSTFFLIERKKDFWAALLIMLGTLVKLYGIVGLAFFFFSKRKGVLVLSLLFWGAVLFALPMLISSPAYVVGQYHEWYVCLLEKNTENIHSVLQNTSLLGFVRRVTGDTTYSDLWLIVPGLLLFAAPYLRFGQWKHLAFRETLLASVMMFVILFSTGSEASGYVIALVGTSIWFTAAPWRRGRWAVALLVLVFLLSGMGNSDIWPRVIRKEYIQAYALRALPVTLVWLRLCWEMLTRDYSPAASRETVLR